jgi:uracil-DNA glycosylase
MTSATDTTIDTLLKHAHYHQSWHEWLVQALRKMDPTYLRNLGRDTEWLPGPAKLLNAFSLPLPEVSYILLGESPYPRQVSANGYAFWDQAVTDIWSNTGLSKQVNRATSLRNIIKMLLVARGDLDKSDTSQTAIADLNKSLYISQLSELFAHLHKKGFLMLNASLVLSKVAVKKEALFWQPFVSDILTTLSNMGPQPKLVLLGKVAKNILAMPISPEMVALQAEHPYNLSFIKNDEVINFFSKHNLLDTD